MRPGIWNSEQSSRRWIQLSQGAYSPDSGIPAALEKVPSVQSPVGCGVQLLLLLLLFPKKIVVKKHVRFTVFKCAVQ